jgi:hypothetical protein
VTYEDPGDAEEVAAMIIVSVRDLMFRSKIQEAAARLGVATRFVPRSATIEQAVTETGGGTVIVDLTQPGILEEIRAVRRTASPHVVGFLGHLQSELMQEASAAGVDEVLARGEFVKRIEEVLLRG